MVANQGIITTLNTGISGTGGLTDGVDKLHSGILKTLFAVGANSRIIECGDFTEDTTGSFTTYTLAADIIYESNGVANIIRSDQTVTMTAADTTYNRYELIYIDTDNTMKLEPGTAVASPTVANLTSGQVPVAIIEIAANCANNASHNVQLLMTDTGFSDTHLIRVKAASGATIAKGQALYISGAHNANVAEVNLARANSASTMPCIGIAFDAMASGEEGFAVVFGKAQGIAANFTAGDTLYVSPTTAGALTDTKPTGATDLIQNVGILFNPHASNASVKITGVGRINDIPNTFSLDTATVANDDKVVVLDTSDSDKLKTVTTQSIANLLDTSSFIEHSDIPDSDTGFVKRTGSETYDIDTNTYLTATDPTLDSVTGNGNTTSNNITVGNAGVANLDVGGKLTLEKNNAPHDGATLNPANDAAIFYLDIAAGVATLPDPNSHIDQVIFIKNVNSATLSITPTVGTIDNALVNHDKRVTVANTIKLLEGESVILQALADGGVTGGPTTVTQGWYILSTDVDTDTGISNVVEDTTPQLGGSLDTQGNDITGDFALTGAVQMKKAVIATGNVSPAASAADSGKYFYRASSETSNFTLPAYTNVGEQYVLMNNSGSSITIAKDSGDTLIGSTSVPHESAVTILAVAANTFFVVG